MENNYQTILLRKRVLLRVGVDEKVGDFSVKQIEAKEKKSVSQKK